MIAVEAIDAEHAIGTAGSLLLCLWRGDTTAAAIGELKKIVRALVARSPDRIMMLTLVESNASMPDSGVRNELSALFRELGTAVAASALIFEGAGFRAAAVRAITTGMNLVAKQPFPHRVFASTNEAAAWMTTNGPPSIAARQIANSLGELRSALDGFGRSRAMAR